MKTPGRLLAKAENVPLFAGFLALHKHEGGTMVYENRDLSDATIEALRHLLNDAKEDTARHGANAVEWLTATIAELRAESLRRPHGGHVIVVDGDDETSRERFANLDMTPQFSAWCHCEWWGDEHANRVAAVAEGDQHLAEVRR